MRKEVLSGLAMLTAIGLGCAGDEFRLGGGASSTSGAGGGKGGAPPGSGGLSESGAGAATATSSSGQGGAAGSGATAVASSGAAGGDPAGPSSSASGGDPPVTLHCHNDLCQAGQVCCHVGDGPSDDVCADIDCPADFSPASCQGPGDCQPAEICCMHLGGGNNFVSVGCAVTCSGPEYLVMCGGDPSVCMGNTCNDSTWLGAGYMWCG